MFFSFTTQNNRPENFRATAFSLCWQTSSRPSATFSTRPPMCPLSGPWAQRQVFVLFQLYYKRYSKILYKIREVRNVPLYHFKTSSKHQLHHILSKLRAQNFDFKGTLTVLKLLFSFDLETYLLQQTCHVLEKYLLHS